MSYNIAKNLMDRSDTIDLTIRFDRFSKREIQILSKGVETGIIKHSYAPTASVAEALRNKIGASYISIHKNGLYPTGHIPKEHPLWDAIKGHWNLVKVSHSDDFEEPFFEEELEKLERMREQCAETSPRDASNPRLEDVFYSRWGRYGIRLFFHYWDASVFNKFKNTIGSIDVNKASTEMVENIRGRKIETMRLSCWAHDDLR